MISWKSQRVRRAAGQTGAALLTLLLLSMVTFWAVQHNGPMAAARSALGRGATDVQLKSYVAQHDLDAPVVQRYGRWLGDFVRGDWGVSPVTQRSVSDDVVPRFRRTLMLALIAIVIALPLSVLLGLYMARRSGGAADMSLLVGSVIVAAMPEFVVGLGLIMVFSVTLGWLPVDSTALDFGTLTEKVVAYILPAATLVLAMVPYIARIARVAIVEALAEPFTQAAVLRGLPRRTVIWGHVMRNAAVPLVNAVAINLVYLLSGVIVVENVFAFSGIGYTLLQAIAQNDTLTVQAIAVVMGAMFIVISLIADMLVVYFNPRLKPAS
ncbi:MAG: peptide/nickel transport system permease protein [Gaiellales bacterium]|jgi:peptide/nickel transport system permease protein|nr:peptide/nickel transport system permease protein [Gaiellales bacterium]MDX6591698.1 peptide/nickel transport system permease protein [Gaiellales bacterium]